jgi:hypothetical protein
VDQLAAVIKSHLKRMQYRPGFTTVGDLAAEDRELMAQYQA